MTTDVVAAARARIQDAIAFQQSLRPYVGDALVDAAVGSLRAQLDRLAGDGAASAAGDAPSTMRLERKVVTVMFADISGFTAMSERMDVENVRTIISAIFDRLVRVIARYEGTVEKFIGDAVVAIFGAPVAHENDPERAVHAALDMMDEVLAFNAEHDTELGIHAGINTGPVIAGYIGPPQARQYAVTGDTVNLAARLEDASKRGQILIGPGTCRRVQNLFQTRTLGVVPLKGKSQPVVVHEVRRVRQPASMVSAPRANMIGRDTELETLVSAFDRLRFSQGGIVYVVGSAGLGKSRLMTEARDSLWDSGIRWLEVRANSFSQTRPYGPFVDMLKAAAGIADGDSPPAVFDRLRALLIPDLGDETDRIMPVLVSLPGMPTGKTNQIAAIRLDEAAIKHQMFRVAHRLFKGMATQNPTAAIFEDMQWADESSIELIVHLLTLAREIPLVICIISRPDGRPAATELLQTAEHDFADHFCRIELSPLPLDDMLQVAESLMRNAKIPSHLLAVVSQKADGNPYFLEEILWALTQHGDLQRLADVSPESLSIPDTLQGVIMARIDRLSDELKDTLKTAAVIGNRFTQSLLQTLIQEELDIERRLESLIEQELIIRKAAADVEYVFRHALHHEVVYESIPLTERRALHERLGESIESMYADRLPEFCGLLAYHFARAEVWSKAADYILQAGDEAARIAADAEALVHYRRALALFGDHGTQLQRGRLERKIGEALLRRGQLDEAEHHLVMAAQRFGVTIPTKRWRIALESVRQILRQIVHRNLPAFLWRKRINDMAPYEELIRTLDTLGWVLYFKDSARFALNVVTSLNTAESIGWASGIARASSGMGIVCDSIGLSRVAENYHRRASACLDALADPMLNGLAHLGMCFHAHHRGDLSGACAEADHSLREYWSVSDLHGWGSALFLKMLSTMYLDRLDGCDKECEEAVRLARETGDDQVLGWARLFSGGLKVLRDNLVEAEEELQEAASVLHAMHDDSMVATAQAWLGMSRLKRGAIEEAYAGLRTATVQTDTRGLENVLTSPLRIAMAEAAVRYAENAPDAERAARLTQARRNCNRALKVGQCNRSVYPEACRITGTLEWIRGRHRQAMSWWRRAIDSATAIGRTKVADETRKEMARYGTC